MKTVFLLRHAKSSWEEPHLDDYDRPLSPRGRKAAPRIGRHMARQGLLPDRVLSSGARRAVETWQLVSEALPAPVHTEFLDEIYHASPGTLLHLIRGLPEEGSSVLLVGHNPTFHRFALQLAGTGKEEDLRSMALKYPTGALAVLDFPASRWVEIDAGKGHLREFVRPRTLKK